MSMGFLEPAVNNVLFVALGAVTSTLVPVALNLWDR